MCDVFAIMHNPCGVWTKIEHKVIKVKNSKNMPLENNEGLQPEPFSPSFIEQRTQLINPAIQKLKPQISFFTMQNSCNIYATHFKHPPKQCNSKP